MLPGAAASAHDGNRRLGRGINFGNALDALPDGAGALRLEERYFDEVKAAGFDSVRLPVRWSAHAADDPPYAIEPDFFARVDRALDLALTRDLNAVLNVHHYQALCADPDTHAARFVALWRQIAARYAGRSGRLYFELLNEPLAAMTVQRWNGLLPVALAAVRESDPHRFVIIGPAQMNSIDALPGLDLPDDERLIVGIHYYSPPSFTHQGAEWVDGTAGRVGTTWGEEADRDAVRHDLARASGWAQEHGRPLFIGEFGVYSKADMASRSRWTAFVRGEAERHGMSWAYWEFGTDFGAYDPQADVWREPLRRALLGG